VRAMRTAIGAGLTAALLMLAADAFAQAPHRHFRDRDGGGPRSLVPMQSAEDATQLDESVPRRPRLTPEERRQLRRDVHDAGRDLYPERERLREQRRAARRGE